MLINSSQGWRGISASPFCKLYSSHLQQLLLYVRVAVLRTRTNGLKAVQKFGTNFSFPRKINAYILLQQLYFPADAGRTTDHGQLAYITGILIGPLSINFTYQNLSPVSHKSKRPV